MKTFCLIALMAVTAGAAARAQSSTIAAPQPLRVTDIYADSMVLDGNGHTVIYHSNVRVIAPDMKLACALLVADLPPSGGRVSHIVAETNVVMDAKDSKGQPVRATGGKAIYDFQVKDSVTNETVTLTGSPQPQIETAQGTNSADEIIWDRTNNSYRWTGNYHFSPNRNAMPADTNAPTATMNNLTAPKTNFPPGTIENIDRIVPPQSQRAF